jgi:hypothetical protein
LPLKIQDTISRGGGKRASGPVSFSSASGAKLQSKKKRPGRPGRFLENYRNLVTTATAISAITTTTIAAVSTTATTAAAATATESAATTTAAFALFHRARFVHGQGAAIDFLAMEFGDRRLGFLGGAHFDEAEATRASRHAIIDHLDPRDVARLGKEIGQVVFRHAKGQIAHIQFYAHFFLLDGLLMFPGSDLRCH